MNCLIFFSLIFSVTLLSSGTLGALRPRGVSLPKKIFYDPSHQFYCLDGSGQFPFHFVNDDFCDCEDGSDEPGTAACGNGVFHCLNHGHTSIDLPSSRVNDGICDCCDSSDEYRSSADCFNNCKELGDAALASAKLIRDNFLKGQEIRNEYIKLGKEKKDEYKALLEELHRQEDKALKVKNDKQDEKENAETRENLILNQEREFKKAQQKRIAAEKRILHEHQQHEDEEGKRVFSELDVNKDGKITAKEIQSFSRFDYDGDGKVSDNEAQFYMRKKESMNFKEFMAGGWKIMKPAFMMEESEDSSPDIEVKRQQSGTDSSKETKIVVNEHEKDIILKDAAVARKDFADADKLFRDIQTEIWHLKRKVKADFGDEDEFLALENQCFEFSEKQYLYKFCPFDKVVQMVKVSKDETLIGLWDSWSGPEDDPYQKMNYSRGASCWNGPNRSVEAHLKCGTENKVISVLESSPCTYVFEFTTPASCKTLPTEVKNILRNEVSFN